MSEQQVTASLQSARDANIPAGADVQSMDAKVEGGTASIEFVVAKANEIYNKWLKEKIPLDDSKQIDEAYKRYRDEYREFAQCYPLTFRYIIQLKSYSAKAFLKYCKYVAKNQWRSYEGFLESQAEYDIFLYKALNPKYDMRVVKERREAVCKSLLDDWNAVKSAYEEVKQEEETRDKSLAERIREALIKQSKERTPVHLSSCNTDNKNANDQLGEKEVNQDINIDNETNQCELVTTTTQLSKITLD